MPIIDTSKEEFKGIPSTLDGEVLLERTKDKAGNVTGFITMDPGELKYYANNKSKAELKVMGYEKYAAQLAAVKALAHITEKAPDAQGI